MRNLGLTLLIFILTSTLSFAKEETPKELEGVNLENKLGAQVDLNLNFTNEEGEAAPLSRYINGTKPVILSLVYYNCPSLCNFVLNGANAGFKELDWDLGNEYEVVTISINPKEKSPLAKTKKESYCKEYGRESAKTGWHFLVSEEANIKALADQVGFQYQYDAKEKQYAHPAVLYVLTPSGKVARYLSGVEFPSRDLRLALVEASEGKIGNVIDQVMLFCYKYDPKKSKYILFASNFMKGSAAGTVLLLGFVLLRGTRRKKI